MTQMYELAKTNLAKALIEALENCKTSDKLATLTDLYVQFNSSTQQLSIYDDDEDLQSQIQFNISEDEDVSEEKLSEQLEELVREVSSEPDFFDRLLDFDLLKPFSLLLVDDNFDQYAEVYLLEAGEVVIEDSLFKNMDKELDDFLDHLLNE
ncbi:MAG: hypothetical protein PHV20_01890 [Bacteroidales bacterium]|nr:hypothetical protein [Bacteroidales bacterium]